MNKTLLSLTACFVLFSTTYNAESNVNIKAEVGFDGYYKLGFWFPVKLNISNSSENIKGRVELRLINKVYTSPIFLARRSSSKVLLYLFVDRVYQRFQVRLIDESKKEKKEKVVAQMEFPLNFPARYEEIFVLCISSVRGELDFLPLQDKQDGMTSPIRVFRVFYMSPEELLDRWKGYDSIDFVAVSESNLDTISDYQRKALEEWIFSGGRILVSGSRKFKEKFKGDRDFPLTRSKLKNGAKSIYSEADGTPILSLKSIGMGKSIFLALERGAYPIDNWEADGDLWQAIIWHLLNVKPKSLTTTADRVAVSMLKNAQKLWDRAPSKPIYPVSIFIGVYLISLAFVNYILNRRLKRWNLSWMAISCLLGLSLIFFILAPHVIALSNASIYSISSFLVFPESKMGSLYGYISLFTPDRSKIQLRILNTDRFFARSFSSEFSGRNQPDGQDGQDGQGGQIEFRQSNHFEIAQEPKAMWSVRRLQVEAQTDWNLGDINIKAEGGKRVQLENLTSINLNDVVFILKERYADIGYASIGSFLKGEKRVVDLTPLNSDDSDDSELNLTPLLDALGSLGSLESSRSTKVAAQKELRRRFLKSLSDLDSWLKPSYPDESVIAGWSHDIDKILKFDIGKELKIQGETLVIIRFGRTQGSPLRKY